MSEPPPLLIISNSGTEFDVYLALNRLFYWVVREQNYINSGWLYGGNAGWFQGGGIVYDIECVLGQHRGRIRRLKSLLLYEESSTESSESSSAFEENNNRNSQIVEPNFDKMERRALRSILARFKVGKGYFSGLVLK